MASGSVVKQGTVDGYMHVTYHFKADVLLMLLKNIAYVNSTLELSMGTCNLNIMDTL